jgi:ribosomal subunit interface protein
VAKALSHFEGEVKEADVKLSVKGGDRGTGPKRQRTEVTVYTLRNGIIRSEDVEDSIYASIDLVCDKVDLAAKRQFMQRPAFRAACAESKMRLCEKRKRSLHCSHSPCCLSVDKLRGTRCFLSSC